MKAPVALEEIEADAGLDIGDTLIGMHLKRVAVPVRLSCLLYTSFSYIGRKIYSFRIKNVQIREVRFCKRAIFYRFHL